MSADDKPQPPPLPPRMLSYASRRTPPKQWSAEAWREALDGCLATIVLFVAVIVTGFLMVCALHAAFAWWHAAAD